MTGHLRGLNLLLKEQIASEGHLSACTAQSNVYACRWAQTTANPLGPLGAHSVRAVHAASL